MAVKEAEEDDLADDLEDVQIDINLKKSSATKNASSIKHKFKLLGVSSIDFLQSFHNE